MAKIYLRDIFVRYPISIPCLIEIGSVYYNKALSDKLQYYVDILGYRVLYFLNKGKPVFQRAFDNNNRHIKVTSLTVLVGLFDIKLRGKS